MGILITILLLSFIILTCVWCGCTNEESPKELFNEFGTTYLKHLEEKIKNKEISEKLLKNELERMQIKIDTCAMVFEEYFAQDQTNDDLLVLAFEELKKMRNVGTSEYEIDKNEEKILKDALRTMEIKLKKLREGEDR